MSKFQICPDEKFLSEVKPVVKKTLERCEKILKPKEKYSVVISPTFDKFITNKMGGTSGFTFQDSKTISIVVNRSAKDWRDSLEKTVAHEFNHIIRFEMVKKKELKYSLLDRLAFDGLAECFEFEVTGQTCQCAKSLSEIVAKKLWRRIKPKLNLISLDLCNQIFYGSKYFPHWGGYTLSFLIVKKKKEELGINWNKLMQMNSKKLIGNGLD